MAQHDYVIANGTGAAVRSDINNGLAAIVTNNSGASVPSTTYAYQWWADTSTNLLKLRNGANSSFITVGDLTAANLGLAALASPTFTGTVTIPTATISTGVGIPLGSAASPAIYFTGDTNTGIYSPGADQFAITTGGSGRVFVDSSGRVGLGTSSVNTKLEIAGSNDAVTENNTLRFTDTDVSTEANQQIGKIEFYSSDASTPGAGVKAYIGAFAADTTPDAYLAFATQDGSVVSTPVERLRITSEGRVGIGTQTPSKILEVAVGSTGALRISGASEGDFSIDASGNVVYDAGIGDGHIFRTNGGTERARIDSSGRLLVGTSSTTQACTIQAQGNSSIGTTGQGILKLSRGESSPANGSALGEVRFTDSGHITAASIESYRDGGTWTSGSSQPTRLVFSTTADGASSPTEQMRITSGGLVLIGATSFPGVGTSTTGVGFGTSGSISAHRTAATTCYFGRSNDGEVVALYSGTSQRGYISISGATTTYGSVSDYRLKENIAPISNAADKVSSLKPSRFNFVEFPEQTVDGFIAHEVQDIVPEAVTGAKDQIDADGNPVYQGIDQSKLVPLLTAALQEALAEIESLKARVTALEP